MVIIQEQWVLAKVVYFDFALIPLGKIWIKFLSYMSLLLYISWQKKKKARLFGKMAYHPLMIIW